MGYAPIPHPVNSQAWWEEYHSKHWDANHGTAQTAHFMERLLDSLPSGVARYLRKGKLEVLDWGCAFGEGVVRLAGAFPRCSVSGLDYSQHAVDVARVRYPSLEFLHTDDGSIPRAFDVIVTSNCLEHFEEPLAIVQDQLGACRSLYIALVPYREESLCEFHASCFNESTFPDRLGDFLRIELKLVDIEPRFWPAPQLLVIYASPRYLASRGPDTRTERERQKWEAYYASLSHAEVPTIDEFGEELSAFVNQLLPEGGRILEAGCGGGQQSMALARSGRHDLTLMDFSAQALGFSRPWFERQGIAAEFVEQDVMVPGSPDFDLVFNAGVLEHYTVDDQVALLKGMASRSRRYVLVLVPNRLCYWYWIWRLTCSSECEWPYGKEIPVADLKDAFAAAGLNPLGQFFAGASWTENFINKLPGLGTRLRETILRVHRSEVIPEWQKSYLLGALACKPEARKLLIPPNLQSSGWPRSSQVENTAIATLADSLAMVLSAENRLAMREADSLKQISELVLEYRAQVASGDRAKSELATLRAEAEKLLSDTPAEIAVAPEPPPAIERSIAELSPKDTESKAVTAGEEPRGYRLQRARLRRLRPFLVPSGSCRESVARYSLRVLRRIRQGSALLARRLSDQLLPRIRQATHLRKHAHTLRRTLLRTTLQRPHSDAEIACVPGLVSVVLPVHNQADLLSASIESVLSQTYSEIELIIVNDGSTDGVEDILTLYEGEPRVRILEQRNQKLPAALTHGFTFARGEFRTWTSADNLMHPEQLRRLVAYLRDHPETAMVYANYLAIDDQGLPLWDSSFRPHNRSTPHSAEITLPRSTGRLNIVSDNFIGPCFLYRGWVGQLIGDYDTAMGIEDYDYWMKINRTFTISHVGSDETLYSYRVHEKSLSHELHGKPIVDLRDRLIATECVRSRFARRPWTIVVADSLRDRLGTDAFKPHETLTSAPAKSPATLLGGVEETRLDPDHTPKLLYLLESAALKGLAEFEQNSKTMVVCLFDTITSVYKTSIMDRQRVHLALTGRSEVAARLSLLGVESLVVRDEARAVSLATKFADNRALLESSVADISSIRELPRAKGSPGRQRILIQLDRLEQGGLENAALGLARGLAAHGLECLLLVVGSREVCADRTRKAGIEVVTLPLEDRENQYRKLIMERGISLVSAHFSVFGSDVVAELRVPFVQVVQNSYVWLSPEQTNAYRMADAHTSAYICVSSEVARYCDCVMGLSVDRMVLIPNGVDLKLLEQARGDSPEALRRELGIGSSDFVVLNSASVHAAKAQVPLVKAFAGVVQAHPQARLVIAGPSPHTEYLRQLEQQIARLGLGRSVILTGYRDDIARFYWMADGFVLPSFWEGWSLALSEAVCTGLPIVASDVGGARDLLEALGGRLVCPPYRAITDLNHWNVGRVVHGDDKRYIAELSTQLRWLCQSSRLHPVPESIISMVNQKRIHEAHVRLYQWLIQGGSAAAARPWCQPPAFNPRPTKGEEKRDRLGFLDDPRPGRAYRTDEAHVREPVQSSAGNPAPGLQSSTHAHRSSDIHL
jgi:glycosyltransferase involved in cell wall biosynthesis/2-polyprenyl-3-methyl-5-hydroxy-6-metoxy-1,4-benzoquinol methylase